MSTCIKCGTESEGMIWIKEKGGLQEEDNYICSDCKYIKYSMEIPVFIRVFEHPEFCNNLDTSKECRYLARNSTFIKAKCKIFPVTLKRKQQNTHVSFSSYDDKFQYFKCKKCTQISKTTYPELFI